MVGNNALKRKIKTMGLKRDGRKSENVISEWKNLNVETSVEIKVLLLA